MKLSVFSVTLLALLVTACMSPEDVARRRAQAQAEEQARYQAQMNARRNKCFGYGYQEGTDGFAGCMQTEALAAERIAQEQAAREQYAREQRQREQQYREQQYQEQKQQREQQQREQQQREQQREHRGEGCTMYEHPNFSGAYLHMPPETQREFVDQFNDKTSSIRVGPRCMLTVYQHVKFQGESRMFNRDANDLGSAWNDQISSAKCRCN